MMRWLWLATLWLGITHVFGQNIGKQWMAEALPDSTSHVWFRQTFLADGRPRQAFVSVAAHGYYKLYVNECNVGTASFYGPSTDEVGAVVAHTFDVSVFLRPDTNTIALVYSPAFPRIERQQIAVSYYGLKADGSPFCHTSDGNWLCRKANSSLTVKDGERIDGRRHYAAWKAATTDEALWTSVSTSGTAQWTAAAHLSATWWDWQTPAHRDSRLWPMSAGSYNIRRRHTPRYQDPKEHGAEYEMGQAFHGLVRITLRDAVKNEKITVDDTEYICRGVWDEQIAPLFHLTTHRRITVKGDNKFQPGQVSDIELLEFGSNP